MKKLLTATLAIAMGATLVGALAACGNNDADTAKKAIQNVRTMYAEKAVETPDNYTVIGQTKVGDDVYAIDWSVTSSFENFGNYVSVGEMDATSKLVTVSVTKAEAAIDYKLIASVTVGSATETEEFTRKVPAKAAEHAGTQEDPYTAANVQEIGEKLANSAYYEVDGAAKQVYVKGYVVDAGTPNASAGRVNNVYIVDEYSADKDKNSADAVLVYSITYDNEVFPGTVPLKSGDLIVVKGFIQKYNNTIEITYKGGDSVLCVSLTPGEDTRTPQQKVNAAINGITTLAVNYNTVGEVDLPATTVPEVTLTWTVKTVTELVTITNNKLNVVSLPDDETEIVLTATATLEGAEAASKDFTVKLKKAADLGLEHAGTTADPYSIADAKKIAASLGDDAYYSINGEAKLVYVKGYVVDPGSYSSSYNNYSNIYLVDEYSAEKDKNSADAMLLYRLGLDSQFVTKDGDLVKGDCMTVLAYIQNYKGKNTTNSYQITYKGNVNPTTVALTPVADDRTDEQKVDDAIAALKLETSYSKTGAVNLPAAPRGVTVTWASSNTELVTITENKTMNIVSIPTSDTQVTVTATVSSGEVSKPKTFTVTVIAELVLEGEGTQAKPYTIADAKKIAASLASGAYYSVNNEATQVYVKGYVVDPGSYSSSYNNYSNIYLVDEYSADKDKNSTDAMLLYRLGLDSQFVKDDGDLRKGDCITVFAYIQNHSKGLQLTYKDKTNPTVVAMVKAPDTRTDAQKVADALIKVNATLSDITKTGDVVLPLSKEDAVTFAWALKTTAPEGVALDGNTLKVTTLPTEDVTLTLTVTATCGDVSTDNTKDVTVKIVGSVVVPAGQTVEANLDFVTGFGTYAKEWANGYAKHEITFKEAGVTNVGGTVELSNGSKQTGTITTKPVICAQNTAQYVTVNVNGASITAVEFDLEQWGSKTFADIHIEYTLDGTTWTSCSSVITTPGKLASTTIPEGVKKIRLSYVASTNKNTQIGLTAIKLTVKGDAAE